MEIEGPIFQFLICLAILIFAVLNPWVRRAASVGLPLCYLISLALIHWLGGLIHALPVPLRSGPDRYTEVGFLQAFWATIAFAIGSFLVAPLILRMLHGESVVRSPNPEQIRLPMVYLGLGITFFALLAPALSSVPSIAAASVSGVYLAVVGVCLACWSAYLQGSYITLVVCLIAICVLPFVTIITLGFVGYGSAV